MEDHLRNCSRRGGSHCDSVATRVLLPAAAPETQACEDAGAGGQGGDAAADAGGQHAGARGDAVEDAAAAGARLECDIAFVALQRKPTQTDTGHKQTHRQTPFTIIHAGLRVILLPLFPLSECD